MAQWQLYSNAAVDRLKKNPTETYTFKQLSDYAASQGAPEDIDKISRFLRMSADVHKEEVLKETGKYKYYPKLGISGPEDMLRVLRNKDTMDGIKAADLKEAWKDMEKDLNDLERRHKIVVIRNKKDNAAKQIYLSAPSLYTQVDEEFRDIWLAVNIKDPQQMRNELAEFGFKTATEIPKVNAPARVEKKRKGKKGGTKITNTHMAGIFKDYQHKRPTAAK